MGNKNGKLKTTMNNEVLDMTVAGSSDQSSTLYRDLVTGIVRVKKIILQSIVGNDNGKCETSQNKEVLATTVAESSDSFANLDPALSGSSATPSLFRNSTDSSLPGGSRCLTLPDVSESPSSCADSIASSSSGLSEEITQNINTILPDEMLLKIFSYMTSDELLSVQFVCTKWQNISRDDSLWKDYEFDTTKLSLDIIASKLKIMPALKIIAGSALKDVVYITLNHVTNLKELNCFFLPALSASDVQILIEKYPKLESVLLFACDAGFMPCLAVLAHSGYIKKLRIFICCAPFGAPSECPCKQNIISMFLLLNDNKSFPVLELLTFPTFYIQDVSSNPDLKYAIPHAVTKRCHLLKSLMASFDDEINMNLLNVSYKCQGLEDLSLSLSKEQFPVVSFDRFALLEGLTIKMEVKGNLFPENLYAPLNSKSLLHVSDLKIYLVCKNKPTGMLPEIQMLKICVENMKQLVSLLYNDVTYVTSENQLQQLGGLLKLERLRAVGIQNISENFLKSVSTCSNLKSLHVTSQKSSIREFNTQIIEMVSAMKKLNTIRVIINSSHNTYFQSKKSVMFTDHFASHAT